MTKKASKAQAEQPPVHHYTVNINTGWKIDGGPTNPTGSIVPLGETFEAVETPELADAVEKGWLHAKPATKAEAKAVREAVAVVAETEGGDGAADQGVAVGGFEPPSGDETSLPAVSAADPPAPAKRRPRSNATASKKK